MDNSADCVICLEPLHSRQTMKAAPEPCNHLFHQDCLEQLREAKCPLCRARITDPGLLSKIEPRHEEELRRNVIHNNRVHLQMTMGVGSVTFLKLVEYMFRLGGLDRMTQQFYNKPEHFQDIFHGYLHDVRRVFREFNCFILRRALYRFHTLFIQHPQAPEWVGREVNPHTGQGGALFEMCMRGIHSWESITDIYDLMRENFPQATQQDLVETLRECERLCLMKQLLSISATAAFGRRGVATWGLSSSGERHSE